MSYKDGILSEVQWGKVRYEAESLADKYRDDPFREGLEADLAARLHAGKLAPNVVQFAIRCVERTP